MRKFLIVAASVLISLFAASGIGLAVSNFDALCSKYVDNVCTEGACSGSASTSPTCKQAAQQQADANNTNPVSGKGGVLQAATNLIAAIAGIAAVIMIVVSGFNLVTSGGDAEKVKKAKAKITSAIIGVVIIALSWTILSFVNEKLIQ